MRATGICPYIWKGDFAGSSLLEEQSVVFIKKENRECSVEKTLRLLGSKTVRVMFGSVTHNVVLFVYQNTLVFEHELFLSGPAVPCGAISGR